MLISTTSNDIGIEYLSWINHELQKTIDKKKATHKKMSIQPGNSICLMTILMLLSPYLIVGLSISALNLLQGI